MYIKEEIEISGRTLSIETGEMAKQADGSVVVRYGDTMVLTTAVAETKEFEITAEKMIPLTVDYREYTYSAGKIPGGFFKREGRSTTKEILTCRLIDRPIRPLFPDNYRNETQIVAFVISADTENNPDVLGIIGASAALNISHIPFDTILGAVRVGYIDGEFVAFPPLSKMQESKLDLVIAGTEDAITMVEAGANEMPEEKMLEAFKFGHEVIKEIVALQKKIIKKIKAKKDKVEKYEYDTTLYKDLEKKAAKKIQEALAIKPKLERREVLRNLFEEILSEFEGDENTERKIMAHRILEDIKISIFRKGVLKDRTRFDGRAFGEIRPITARVGFLPRTHGSSLFTRGETQALVTATLGTDSDEQILDSIQEDTSKRFMLHYNFPPFSVGEVKFLRGPGRREIGHGALAERAIINMMPSEEDFPYVVRVVSDIMESNGSSSMATVCGGVLALMDAGIPIKNPIAGIAMGLVTDKDDYAILSDIAGEEDHYGDMDFKVAGSRDGITALQMDIKVGGLKPEIMGEALEQARQGRLFILDKMLEVISEPRKELSVYAPRVHVMTIPEEKIKDVIGPGGKMIKSIIAETGVKIDISDDGTVRIYAVDPIMGEKAIQKVKSLTALPEVGLTYKGKVVKIMEYGAFVNILPGTDGLLHVSEIAPYRVNDVSKEFKEGDEIEVKVIGMEDGKIKLSRKALLPPGMVKDSSNSGHSDPGGNDRPYERRERRFDRGRDRSGDRFDRGERGGRKNDK